MCTIHIDIKNMEVPQYFQTLPPRLLDQTMARPQQTWRLLVLLQTLYGAQTSAVHLLSGDADIKEVLKDKQAHPKQAEVRGVVNRIVCACGWIRPGVLSDKKHRQPN